MAVKIGSARINEKGTISGGTAGDQTGGEVSTQNWYLHNKGWIVIRALDPDAAEKIASCMEMACANDKIGYCQDHRSTLTTEAKKYGYNVSKVTKSVEVDCSELVRVCCLYAGIPVESFSTSTEKNVLQATGEFDVLTGAKYCASSAYLKRGDILVTKTKGHTVVVLNNGSCVSLSGSSGSGNYYPAFDSTSIVDGLAGIGEDSSKETRAAIAAANRINNYSGTYAQNVKLCDLARQGKLKRPGTSGSTPAASGGSTGYQVGEVYMLQSNMKVRTGPGTGYRMKSHNELTADGRQHDKDRNGCLDAGTKVTCKAVKTSGNQTWIRCPSGWICAEDGGVVYVR